MPADDPRQRKPDISFAERHLGWRPAIALDDGLDRTVPWFESLLRESVPSAQAARPLGRMNRARRPEARAKLSTAAE